MHLSPRPPLPDKNQPTAPPRTLLRATRHRTEPGLIGVVVLLPCHHPCCDSLRQITPAPPAVSIRGVSDTETLQQAARPRGAKAMWPFRP
ncbi:hypothetical protein [Streptomyces humi]